jgi:hypothetical protein
MAESRLADIYRKELKNKGLLGALVSASGARLKEKTDIRGLLPQTGISGAAFEKMFGKKYRYGVRSAGGDSSGADTKPMEEKLTRIGVDMKIMAKNTVVLPAMARDMNLMRMNMQKMVKLSGGTPATKSDMFFKRASDRESQYEGQFKKSGGGGLSPTPVGGNKEGEGGGFLSTILGFFKGGIGNIVETLLGVLIKGGLIAGFIVALGKYFQDDNGFRQTVNNMLDTIFKTVFGDEYKKNLATGAAVLLAAYVAFKGSLALLEAAIAAAARRILMLGGGPGLPSGPGQPKGKGLLAKIGRYGLYGMAGYGAYEGYNSIFGDNNAGSKGTDGVPTDSVSKKNLGLNTDTALAVGGTALGAAGLAYSASKLTKTLTPTSPTPASGTKPGFLMTAEEKIQSRAATQVKSSSKWGKFLAFVAKKSPALFARLGVKLAAMAGMATIPIVGWLSALFQLGFIGLDLYAIYSLWSEFTNTDEETANPDVNEAAAAATKNATQIPGAGGDSNQPLSLIDKGRAMLGIKPGGTSPTDTSRYSTPPSTSPTKASSGDSRKSIEDYLGRSISDDEHDMLMRAVYAEASQNKSEYANVMAVILNRTRKNGGTIIGTLNERNQFQAVTGTRNNPGPSANFKRGPDGKSIAMINEGASSLSGISKSLDAFTASNRNAYGPGTNVSWLDKLQANGGKQIGQTVFAENMYRGGGAVPATATASASAPNTGNALTDLFTEYSTFRDEYMKQTGGGNTTVHAPVTNVQNGGGGGGNNMNPYDPEIAKAMMNRRYI